MKVGNNSNMQAKGSYTGAGRPDLVYQNNQVIQNELLTGERILWSGMPLQGVRLQNSDFFAIPFSLMWGGSAIFWEYSVVHLKNAPVIMMLWGIPFVLIGLYLIFGRFFTDAYMRTRTYYAITDQRVIIVSGLISRTVKTLSLRNLPDLSFRERANRTGSITFGSSASPFGLNLGTSWPGSRRVLPPAFGPISDARKVYEVLLNAQKHASAT